MLEIYSGDDITGCSEYLYRPGNFYSLC